jgi:hypothetical protein
LGGDNVVLQVVKTAGGMGRDSWAMVSNRDPLPAINISTSRREEIETWIHFHGHNGICGETTGWARR